MIVHREGTERDQKSSVIVGSAKTSPRQRVGEKVASGKKETGKRKFREGGRSVSP